MLCITCLADVLEPYTELGPDLADLEVPRVLPGRIEMHVRFIQGAAGLGVMRLEESGEGR